MEKKKGRRKDRAVPGAAVMTTVWNGSMTIKLNICMRYASLKYSKNLNIVVEEKIS